MKKIILILILITGVILNAQDKRYLDKDKPEKLEKANAIKDRAAGIHNAGNIGLFFENRGKLYPRRITQGPSGEFPINSGKNYIYRIAPFVGIPGNVIQGRHTGNEEWEAVGGYHNPEFSQVAMSDNKKTWPATGWHLKDELNNPIIKSDQDSYCVFNDSLNSRQILGIEMRQTGYTYGVKFAQNIIFYKYEMINKSNKRLDNVYFAMYADIDVGNISGGLPEYSDDKVGFDKKTGYMYFYDDGISNEWPGGKTGYFGVSIMRTPKINGVEKGVTDFHYFLYNDDEDRDLDTIQYGLMASSRSLYESNLGPKYFHLGNSSNLHFDDPSTIPAEGLDLAGMISSGPYTLEPGEKIEFVTAIVAGENYNEAMASMNSAYKIMEFDFEISKPPITPKLSGTAGDGSVTIFWDDLAETSKDNFSGEYDFEGYRVYKSQDKGINWEQLADYDLKNKIGFDVGLQYSFTDKKVTNGFEYWYSVTAYDRGDSSIASLESPKGNNTDAVNLVSMTPLSKAAGYTPVSSLPVKKIGTGVSNYEFEVMPVDNNDLAGNKYTAGFTYTKRHDKGNNKTKLEITIRDSAKTNMNEYGIEWIARNRVQLIDLLTGDFIEPNPKTYISGARYNLNSGLAIKLTDPEPQGDPDFLPNNGDYMSVHFGTYVVKNGTDTVVYPRQLETDKLQSTSDGVVFKFKKPDLVKDLSKVGGLDNVNMTFTIGDETAFTGGSYLISTNGKGTVGDRGFVKILVRDASQNTVAEFDSVFTGESFTFNGITGKVTFESGKAPSPGNIFSFTAVKPVPPTLKDKYQFEIKGSTIDKEKLTAEAVNIKVVPNPYIVSSLYEPEFGELRREPLRQIQFINLPNECTIYIFTIDADLVKTIYHNAVSGTEAWDLRSEGGREISPGIYMYVVKADGVEFKSRFAIIK